MRWMLVAMLACLPVLAPAHTLIILDGTLVVGDGRADLTLEATPLVVARLAGEARTQVRSIGELRACAPEVAAHLRSGVVLHQDGRELVPAWAGLVRETRGWGDASLPPDRVERLLVSFDLVSDAPVRIELRLFAGEEVTVAATIRTSGGVTALGSTASSPPGDMPATTPEDQAAALSTLGARFRLGFAHIVPDGADHMLFIVALAVVAAPLALLLWQITAFTVAHSITLGLALGGMIPAAGWLDRGVEIAIACSIAWVAIEALLPGRAAWRDPAAPRRMGLPPGGTLRVGVVGAFGLVHGLGFAGALAAAPWPQDGFLASLAAANLGIEAAQLAVAGVVIGITAWWRDRSWYHGRVATPVCIAIGACGLWWAVQRAM